MPSMTLPALWIPFQCAATFAAEMLPVRPWSSSHTSGVSSGMFRAMLPRSFPLRLETVIVAAVFLSSSDASLRLLAQKGSVAAWEPT